MGWILKFKGYAYAVGAIIMVGLGMLARMAQLKRARDAAELEAEVLKAQAHAHRIKAKIVKEEKTKLSSKESNIIEEVKKEGEDFEGVDNLTDSNDW